VTEALPVLPRRGERSLPAADCKFGDLPELLDLIARGTGRICGMPW
jgi:hypothetical protein